MENLTDAAREAMREYYREWRRNNKDKVHQYNENYWRRRAEKMQKGEDGGKNV